MKRAPSCHCHASMAICGCISYGSGRLDEFGFWEHPCPHGQAFEPYDHDCEWHGKVAQSAEEAL